MNAQQDFTNKICGLWHGTGILAGKPAKFEMHWKKQLNQNFLTLSFQNQVGESVYKAEAFYKSENDKFTGHWFDNMGMVIQLSGILVADTFQIFWTNGKNENGKSKYVLLSENELQITDFRRNGNDYKVFAESKLKRFSGDTANPSSAVNGIGGVFIQVNNLDKSREWYRKYLGIDSGDHGVSFSWRDAQNPAKKGYTVWHLYEKDDEYFKGRNSNTYMINYRVNDLDKLLYKLKQQGIEALGETETYSYGKFAWIIDPDGNKIELWEPYDEQYQEIPKEESKKKK